MFMIKSYKKVLVNYKMCYIKVLEVLKTIWKILKSVRKSRTAENPHHAETSLPTHNENKLAGCSTYIHIF